MLTLVVALHAVARPPWRSGDANGIAAEGEGFAFPEYAQAPVGTGPYTFGEYDEANADDHAREERRLLGRGARRPTSWSSG